METASNHLSVQQIISAASELSLPDLDQLFENVLALRARKRTSQPPKTELALLQRINNTTLSAPLRERYQYLKARRANNAITDEEYAELSRLVTQVEENHAERMQALGELAALRGVGLDEVMRQQGIRFPEYG